ncbi:30S ribosomal protein S3 [uncultured archaeon]|nr:30S ribosomal protein S3 [uncultured archaeon]
MRYQVSNFLEKELDRAGFTHVDIQRTPMVTRIAVEVTTPGRVIGKKGRTIRDLTDAISSDFHMDKPQISLVETAKPELEPRLVAKKICRFIEMGKKPRAILHSALRDIMANGALGAEIIAAGKLAAKGGRSKALRVMAGYVPKAGEPARLVKIGYVTAYPKSGAIGVLVRLVMPGTVFPDKGVVTKVEIPNLIAHAESVENTERARDETVDPLKGMTAPPKRRAPPRRPMRRR